ncbi:MAG: response regulator transcription factor [Ilumatobacter sp.]|uniref:response regulator transcription factor n=1 Tax=Ilumatobacter sp. TaxID=1967498 RepID=UPI003C75F658
MQRLQDAGPAPVIRVVIVDDHRVLAELLTAALSMSDEVAVIESVGTATEAIVRVGALQPDVVVLDYDLPDGDGVSAVASIKDACTTCRVLMLTSYTDPVVLSEAFDAGCDGFVTKRNGASEILAAVLAVASNETPVSADMVATLVRPNSAGVGADLTERELEVLRIASLGHSNKEIAAELYLSINTVRNHMQHVLNKLGAHSKLEATAVAVRAGILRR